MSKRAQQLLELKNRLKIILDRLDSRKRLIYVDYPLHLNIGDLLINLGTEEFFSAYGLRVQHRYSYHDLPRRIPDISDQDVVIFHGGGNFGDLYYPEHFAFLLRILTRFPRNTVIVLPQTPNFKSAEREAEVLRGLAGHRNLHIFVRDIRAYSRLQQYGLSDLALAPDMAHQLAGQLQSNPSVGEEEALYFIRRDEEAGNIPASVKFKAGSSVDWEDCIRMSHRVSFGLLFRTIRLAGSWGFSPNLYRLWYKIRDSLIADGIELISRSQQVYTNRLHAMILGVLLDRGVTAFDNSYGKLSAYYDSWLIDLPGVEFIPNTTLNTGSNT